MNSSQPPSDHEHVDEAPADDGALADPSSGPSRRPRWQTIVTAIVVLMLAGAVAGALLTTHEDARPKERASPTEGLACPYLQQAADAYNGGDRAAFESAISQAATVAEDTLQTSGQTFGKPERIALELGLSDNRNVDHIVSLLERAAQDCQALASSLTPP
jgi:hypothetical protein